jgi:hypothetical protein
MRAVSTLNGTTVLHILALGQKRPVRGIRGILISMTCVRYDRCSKTVIAKKG